ncbi:hypothetical protein Bca4012_089049 [Brassica carinata]
MAHSRVWNSACRGVKTRLLANEPIIPPPKRLSSLCQEASITIASSSCGFSMIWASFQLSASDLARWMVSSGVMSLPLKALSLRAFHMNQLIHGTVAMILSGIANSFARHRTPGRRGISARAQAWIEGGHSKSRWFRVSSSAPHRGQLRSVPQWRSESELQTGTQFERACQIK